jgi:hypothetical protein
MLVVPTKAKASVAADPRWITSALLRALVTLAPAAGNRFTMPQLAAALADVPAVRRQRGITKLLGLRFITYRRQLVDGVSTCVYIVTPDGAAAIAAAGQGAMLMPGAHQAKQPAKGTLRHRLWALIRIRKVLDAEEAVKLLADAGDPAYISKRNKANECLRRWAQAGALQLSAKVGPKGQKRYVLLTDSPEVPAFITPIESAQAGTQAGR